MRCTRLEDLILENLGLAGRLITKEPCSRLEGFDKFLHCLTDFGNAGAGEYPSTLEANVLSARSHPMRSGDVARDLTERGKVFSQRLAGGGSSWAKEGSLQTSLLQEGFCASGLGGGWTAV